MKLTDLAVGRPIATAMVFMRMIQASGLLAGKSAASSIA